MRTIIFFVISLFLVVRGIPQPDTLSLRKKVAILDMSDMSGWKDGNAGSAVTTMLITEMAKSEKFQVVEKEMLQGVVGQSTREINIQRLNQQRSAACSYRRSNRIRYENTY